MALAQSTTGDGTTGQNQDFKWAIDPALLDSLQETLQTAHATDTFVNEWDFEKFLEATSPSSDSLDDAGHDALLDISASDSWAGRVPTKCSFPGCKSTIRFTRRCDLRKHLRLHERTLFCRYDGCPKSRRAKGVDTTGQAGWFATAKDRNRHEGKHNPSVVCQGFKSDGSRCGRVFSRKDNMITHMKKTHGLSVSLGGDSDSASPPSSNDFHWADGLDTAELDEQPNMDEFPWMEGYVDPALSDRPGGNKPQLDSENVSYGDISSYIEWLKNNTKLEGPKLDAALPKLEESAIVLDQIPYLTKQDLLGIGLPLGIVVALQHNYERFHRI
ncbi:hypothetical protein GQ53DRAFT_825711 [Thozetella sp. PMI_491]|nr:hypothetical protein GQ53DRAFT_825711 [Thozetella sp. PMI_491]